MCGVIQQTFHAFAIQTNSKWIEQRSIYSISFSTKATKKNEIVDVCWFCYLYFFKTARIRAKSHLNCILWQFNGWFLVAQLFSFGFDCRCCRRRRGRRHHCCYCYKCYCCRLCCRFVFKNSVQISSGILHCIAITLCKFALMSFHMFSYVERGPISGQLPSTANIMKERLREKNETKKKTFFWSERTSERISERTN